MTQAQMGAGNKACQKQPAEESADVLGNTGTAVGAVLADIRDNGGHPGCGPVTIAPANQQYPDLISGTNQRFIGKPEAVQLIDSTSQVLKIFKQAVSSSGGPVRRAAVRVRGPVPYVHHQSSRGDQE